MLSQSLHATNSLIANGLAAKGVKMNKIISACGLDCLSCECYIATKNQDSAAKATIDALRD